jgi:hypothetical protein
VTALAALLVLAAATAAADDNPHIDHVMVGVSDLDRGIAEMERLTGVQAVRGGAHPGKGTRNALMSLGARTYLEIIAPDPAQHVRSADAAMLRKSKRPTVIGWAVSAADRRELRRRADAAGLALTPWQPGSRVMPNGRMLKWRTFGYARDSDPNLPFFIAWSDPRLHPSRTSPGGCRLQSMTLGDPRPAKLHRAIAPLGLNVQVETAQREHMRIMLRCPKGQVAIG